MLKKGHGVHDEEGRSEISSCTSIANESASQNDLVFAQFVAASQGLRMYGRVQQMRLRQNRKDDELERDAKFMTFDVTADRWSKDHRGSQKEFHV